jgi:hypothetical protein
MDVFQSVYIPKQTQRKTYGDGNMEAIITSYPPLGQVTLVDGTTIAFTVLLQTDKSGVSNRWEVSLWHSGVNEWRESPLKSVTSSDANIPMLSQASNDVHAHRLYFTVSVEVISPMSFTMKFRTAPDQPWRWVKDYQGTIDGTVLSKFKFHKTRTEDLNDLIKNLNPIVEAKQVLSQSPDTTVWSATVPVPAADGEKSRMIDVCFGLPWAGEILRYGYANHFGFYFYILASILFYSIQDVGMLQIRASYKNSYLQLLWFGGVPNKARGQTRKI